MKNKQENKENIIRYLFGELPETVRNEFEELLFSDEDLSIYLEDIENDLIDEYIRGELEFDEKRRFEKKYLTTESRQNRVDLARTLQAKVFNEEKTTVISQTEKTGIWTSISSLFGISNPVLAGSVAVLLLMTLFGGYWFITQQGTNQDIAESNNSNETPLPEILPKPRESPVQKSQSNNSAEDDVESSDVNTKPTPSPKTKTDNNSEKKPTPRVPKKEPKTKREPKAVPKQSTVFAFSLMPPLRSSSTPILNIPSSAKTVRLRLFDNFGRKYKKFIVEVNNAIGKRIWRKQISASKKRLQKSIVVNIPKLYFNGGNYEIAVLGITKGGDVEEINFYNFIVRKR